MKISDNAGKTELAHRWLREQITNGTFGPGYRLVLNALAADLSMSVAPVRAAIRQLADEGLVTVERHVGARVAMADPAEYGYSMEVIGVAESAATAQAAPHLTDEDLSRARALNEVMRGGPRALDSRLLGALNQEFHQVLYAKCPNPRLLHVVETEWARLGQLRESVFTLVPDRAPESVREHDVIIELIASGAPAREIELAVREHRTHSLTAVLAHGNGTQQTADLSLLDGA
jgi:DNA-binding GntR family transcriptional regulator